MSRFSASTIPQKNDFQLFLVRHGQTEANAAGILQGQCDYPLTPKGLAEATYVGDCLKNVSFEKVYCSDLKRAHDTCKLLLEQKPESFREDLSPTPLLRELCFGLKEALPRDTPLDIARRIQAERKGIPESEVVDDTEPPESVKARQMEFLASLKGLRGPVLAVSHGAYIRHLVQNTIGRRPPRVRNCSITVLQLSWDETSQDLRVTCDVNHLSFDKHLPPVEPEEPSEISDKQTPSAPGADQIKVHSSSDPGIHDVSYFWPAV